MGTALTPMEEAIMFKETVTEKRQDDAQPDHAESFLLFLSLVALLLYAVLNHS